MKLGIEAFNHFIVIETGKLGQDESGAVNTDARMREMSFREPIGFGVGEEQERGPVAQMVVRSMRNSRGRFTRRTRARKGTR